MADDGLATIRQARRDLDAVVKEIQRVRGFETFLAAPTFADVAAADDRPLVYLSATDAGGMALIVRDGDVVDVSLPLATAPMVREQVTRYFAEYAGYRADAAAGFGSWTAALETIAQWAWDAVMWPVLEVTGAAEELVLVAGGMTGLIPLHAAWTADAGVPAGRRHALDDAVITYAPNARALSVARQVAERARTDRALVIIDPRPVPAPPLAAAGIEGAAAAAALPGAMVLAGGEATTAAFQREAERVGFLHLACHGLADLESPLKSGLMFAGGQDVSLRELLGMSLGVRLAVLSACETSLPGTGLPDEVVALPTGLLQAGVAGVIASQWAVPDFATAVLMTEFHSRATGSRPAVALRDAQRWMRDTTNGEKVEAWELRARSGSLPQEVAEALIDRLAFADPAARDHAELRMWAGFAYIGV